MQSRTENRPVRNLGAYFLSTKIPDGIDRQHILAALQDLDRGADHSFGDSTGYDLLYEGRRYPPKAAVGIAAGKLTGHCLGPYDFKGGLKSKCFRVLTKNGFTIIAKGEANLFPDEVNEAEIFVEGAVQLISVNRYERDQDARGKAIEHYGPRCQVCEFDFSATYGTLGDGFIHVHHIVPLSQLKGSYIVNPIQDLRPVCPNCHAMLHKSTPPLTIEKLRGFIAIEGKLGNR